MYNQESDLSMSVQEARKRSMLALQIIVFLLGLVINVVTLFSAIKQTVLPGSLQQARFWMQARSFPLQWTGRMTSG
jgi:hypothetical protein